MMQLEEIELLARQHVGGTQASPGDFSLWSTTQKTMYRILIDFGVQVAKRADQLAERAKKASS